MPAGHSRPRFERVEGVRSRAVDDEFVVVDPASGRAHALSGVTAQVWDWFADGPVPEVDSGALQAAIDALLAAGLLRPVGVSRRGLLRTGAGLAVGVGIASIVLPEASAAASGLTSGSKSGSGSFTIPKNARNITITFTGGSGGYAQDHSGTPGFGGSMTYKYPGTLPSDLVVAYNVGKQGSGPLTAMTTARQDIYTSASGGAGGTGGFAGGTAGGAELGTFPDLGGGGGGATSVVLSGAVTGTLIAGGGGGAGDGYNGDFTTTGKNTGGNGGSVGALGGGGAGTAGTVGGIGGAGLGGLGGVLGGTGAVGQSGTPSSTSNTNGGGGGGGGGNAGLAGGNGVGANFDKAAAGGGGAGSSSNPNLLVNVTLGTLGTLGDGVFTYSYTT